MKKISFSLLFIVLLAAISFSCSNVSDGGGARGSCDCNSTGSTSGGGSNTDDELYRHSIGRIYYSDGTSSYNYISTKNPLGFIVSINEDGTVDKLLSLVSADSELAFGPDGNYYTVNTTDDDGKANCEEIRTKIEKSLPAINWCQNFDANIEGFEAGTWYLPSRDELISIYANYEFFKKSYDSLMENGYTGKLSGFSGNHWSSTLYVTTSTSDKDRYFYYVNLGNGAYAAHRISTKSKLFVRAMYKFKYE